MNPNVSRFGGVLNIKIVYKKLKENSINLTACAYHVTYAFQSKSTLCSCLNVKELIAWNRREIWSLSDCNKIRTHNQLVRKRTLNHLAKQAIFFNFKWLSCVVSTYMYGASDCMCLSCHVRLSKCLLIVGLRTKWLWVRVSLQSLKLQISRLFRAKSSLTFRQL